jgi:hypothetical protein
MGGPGSGGHSSRRGGGKKGVVEDCLSLNVNRWSREGILKAGACVTGNWQSTYQGGGTFRVNYEANTLDPARPFVRLRYSWVWGVTREKESADYPIRLAATRPRLGGLCWWCVCPLVVNGVACGHRVGKLNLPDRERYFGCRHYHRLTYTSCQQQDKRVDALRRDPDALTAILNKPRGNRLRQLTLALKALEQGLPRAGR